MPYHFSEPSGIVIPEILPPSTPYEGNENNRLSHNQIREAVSSVAKSPYDNSVIWNILSHANDLFATNIEQGLLWLKGIEQSNIGRFRGSIVSKVQEIMNKKDGKQLILHFGNPETF